MRIRKKKPRIPTLKFSNGLEYNFRGTYGLLYMTLPPTWPWYRKAWHSWRASKLPSFAEQRAYLVQVLQGHVAKENEHRAMLRRIVEAEQSNANSLEAYKKP